jgi:HPt (histidine-containing phosphotransfer) domain-containing protein
MNQLLRQQSLVEDFEPEAAPTPQHLEQKGPAAVRCSAKSLARLIKRLVQRGRDSIFQITVRLGVGGAESDQTLNETSTKRLTMVADECAHAQREDSPLPITIDRKVMMKYCTNDPEVAKMVLQKFHIEAGQCLEIMEMSICQDSAKGVHRAAHALKCVAMLLSADEIARRAKQLELMGQLHRLDQAPRILNALRREVEQFVAAIPHENESMNSTSAPQSSLADQADAT